MGNLLTRLSGYQGTGPEGLAFQHMGPRRVPLPGTPIGITRDSTTSLVGLDLTMMRDLMPELQVKDVGIIAEQGFGKTFLLMLLMYYWSVLDVNGGFLRSRLDSYKRNNRQRPETAPLVEDLFNCKIISPFSMRINPLSRRFKMTLVEKFALTTRLVRHMTGLQRLSLEEETVLREALATIESDLTKDPSFPALERILKNYQPSDVEETSVQMDQEAGDVSYRTTLRRNNTMSKHQRLLDAAFQMELATGLLNEGEFATLLSGEDNGNETFRLLTQRFVSVDQTGVDERFRSVMEIVFGALDATASTPYPGDEENTGPRIPELLTHVIATDEAYRPWENPEFAAADYQRRKIRRASGETGVMVFHRLRDFLEAIGNDQAGKKARNALSEIKVWFIGRQNKDSLKDIRAFFDLPDQVVESLTTLRKGEFWLIVPGQAIPIIIMAPQKLVKTFNTEGAHQHLLDKYYQTGDKKYYITYLTETTPETQEKEEGGVVRDEVEGLV